MRILVLDDSAARARAFRDLLAEDELTVVETAGEAIRLLRDRDWDAVSLDHDLGGEEMVASGPGTGWEVARWLADHPDRIPETVVLHSFNPAGRANMAALLPGAVQMPGWWVGAKREERR